MMAIIEIFSSPVDYKYKTKICSSSFLIVLFFLTSSLLTPFFIIYNAGGFSLKNHVYVEKPDISFNYKYLLLADRGYNITPIVCSEFITYKNNEITDSCILVKVQEIDTNSDGKKDIIKFEAKFYTDIPIKSFKLLLFFNFQLKQLFEITVETVAFFAHILNEEIQKVDFYGDLVLQQKGFITSKGLHEVHNHNMEIADYLLEELFMQNVKNRFSAKINDKYVLQKVGYSNENTMVIHGKIIYREYLIYYQPSIWEELNWAWVQYLSWLVVLTYIVKHVLIFLFTNQYLKSYIVVPWREK